MASSKRHLSARPLYCGIAEISVYVHDSHKQKGVGKKLIEAIIPISEQNGIWTIYSSIFANNLASLALHKSCGFREIGKREKLAKDKFGVWRDTILMERRSPLPEYN